MSNAMMVGDEDAGGFGQAPGKDREPRWDEKIRWLSLPDDSSPYAYRLVGKPAYFFNHWVTTKKRDGQWGKPLAVLCKNFDSTQGKFVENGCKVCEFYRNAQKVYGDMKIAYEQWPAHVKKIGARSTMAINAIFRELQQQGAPAGAKDWSFVVPLKFPKGQAENIVELAQKFNRKPGAAKEDKTGFYGFNHAQHGRDLLISFNSQADASKMYNIQLGDKTPLTEEELAHAKYMVDFVSHLKYMADNKVEELLQRGGYYELLQGLQAQHALQQAQAKVGLNTQPAPAQEIPRNIQTAQNTAPQSAPAIQEQPAAHTVPSAMQTEEDGGMTPTEEDIPNSLTQAANSTQSNQPAASPAASTQVTSTTAGEDAKVQAFAPQFGKGTKTVTENYAGLSLRSVTTGSVVPACFSQYSETRAAQPEGCKACPVKLDCMQVEP